MIVTRKKFSGHSLALNWSYYSIKCTWNVCRKLILVFDTNRSPWESLNFFPYRKIIYGCAFFHIFPQILTNQLCLNQISGLDSRNIYPRPIKISLTVFYHAKLRAYDKIFGYVWKNTILEGTPNFFFKSLGFPLKKLNKNFCQTQFQLASQASVTLELRLALLSLCVQIPTHPSTRTSIFEHCGAK